MQCPINLHLDQLGEVISELEESLAEYMYGAAVMCLHYNEHKSGVPCEVRDFEERLADATISWTKQYSDKIRRTFGDTDYAVEFAAEGIACLTIDAFTEYTVVERAVRHDGVDFWLAQAGPDARYPFQRTARMESKGITEARYPSDITYALKSGVDQVKQSDQSQLPAYIIATELSKPVIYMVRR